LFLLKLFALCDLFIRDYLIGLLKPFQEVNHLLFIREELFEFVFLMMSINKSWILLQVTCIECVDLFAIAITESICSTI
jgi:hypothetical protein